jgi:hypothetical protein
MHTKIFQKYQQKLKIVLKVYPMIIFLHKIYNINIF